MKTKVDIITGFLESGKTSFINDMFTDGSFSPDERIVIIQLEIGEAEIDEKRFKDRKVFVRKPDAGKIADSEYIIKVLDKYYPDRLIIEYNGMEKLDGIFLLFDSRDIRRHCYINRIINIIDVSTFKIYMNNLGPVLIDQINGSDLVVLNKAAGTEREYDKIVKTVRTLNKSAEIAIQTLNHGTEKAIDTANSNNTDKKASYSMLHVSDRFFSIFFICIAAYLVFSIFRSINVNNAAGVNLSGVEALNTVFISILMQAFPFILVGVFVSSIIQVLIPSKTMIRLFPKRLVPGFIVAMLSGVLFPVCDCAVVPVAARLVKKGVPVPVATVFMLSAPIVNPIVIASTLYAFPGKPSIAFFRVYIGLMVALTVGILLYFFPENKDVLKGNPDEIACSCGHCGEKLTESRGIAAKLGSIFRHAGSEFFAVGKFLIIGAFLSSIMQTMIPKDVFNSLQGKNALSLLVMMTAAFVFSVCSTSDAFIGRTFTNHFPASSVMGFLILGPMIDIKNLLMLLSSYRKGFVIKLTALIFGFAFVIILLVTPFITFGG